MCRMAVAAGDESSTANTIAPQCDEFIKTAALSSEHLARMEATAAVLFSEVGPGVPHAPRAPLWTPPPQLK